MAEPKNDIPVRIICGAKKKPRKIPRNVTIEFLINMVTSLGFSIGNAWHITYGPESIVLRQWATAVRYFDETPDCKRLELKVIAGAVPEVNSRVTASSGFGMQLNNLTSNVIKVRFLHLNKKKMRKMPKKLTTEELDNAMIRIFPDLRGKKYHMEYTDGNWIEDEDDWECMHSSLKSSDFTNGCIDIQVVVDSKGMSSVSLQPSVPMISQAASVIPQNWVDPTWTGDSNFPKVVDERSEPSHLQQPPAKKIKTSHIMPNGLPYMILGCFKAPDETSTGTFAPLYWDSKAKPIPNEETCTAIKEGNWRGALNEFICWDKRVKSFIQLNFTFKGGTQKDGNIARFICEGKASCRGVNYIGYALSGTKKTSKKGAAKALLIALGGIKEDFLSVLEKAAGGTSNTGEVDWDEAVKTLKMIKEKREEFADLQTKLLLTPKPPPVVKKAKLRSSWDSKNCENEGTWSKGGFKKRDPSAALFPNRGAGYGGAAFRMRDPSASLFPMGVRKYGAVDPSAALFPNQNHGYGSGFRRGFGRSPRGYLGGWNRGRWNRGYGD